jgi:nucleotide-binding universal stress UspA family protein
VKTILAATDFSSRSDRAIRRAVLLAKQHDASTVLVHVVDDDQPQRILRVEQMETSAVLEDMARTTREVDGVACHSKIVLGDPFEGIVKAGDEDDADVIVMGEHRRQALKNVFVGTTAERTIRNSRRPVLIASAVPASFYRHVLIATDLSDSSREALHAVVALGLNKQAEVSVVHVFDAFGSGLMTRASLNEDQVKYYVETERDRAAQDLAGFLQDMPIQPMYRLLKLNESSPASAICLAAKEIAADLIVVGTHGRTGITKFLLGSVAENVLRTSACDVLAVPRRHLS